VTLLESLENEIAIGVFSKTIDSSFVEATGIAGVNFIILDQEHGPSSLETLHNHVRAGKVSNIATIIRVKGVDQHSIGSALDTGADGVQVPNINSAEQAKAAVAAARFHPTGSRGVCRFVRAAKFGSTDKNEYFSNANKAAVVLQVEGVDGVRNIDEILSVTGYDILFIGPYDLSQSVGKPGEVNSTEVVSLIREIAKKAHSKGVILGAFCDTQSNMQMMRDLGFKYIAFSVDINIYEEACKMIMRQNT
tara:strand:+ start:3816 stop:4562 length:747 start_codon:yes stop_codon:yes gene_type:complete